MAREPPAVAARRRASAGCAATRRTWLRHDVTAGLTAAAVVIPKAMAYATIAGLPVQVGLYTAFVPMVVYALLGTSRPLSVSSTTTIAILSAAALGWRFPAATRRSWSPPPRRWPCWSARCWCSPRCCGSASSPTSFPSPCWSASRPASALVIVVDQLPKLLGMHIDKAGLLPRPARDRRSSCRRPPSPTLALALAAVRGDLRPGALRAARARRR